MALRSSSFIFAYIGQGISVLSLPGLSPFSIIARLDLNLATNSFSVHLPIPVVESGVILATVTSTKSALKCIPPAKALLKSGAPCGVIGVWQSLHDASVTRYSPYFTLSDGSGL